MTRIFRQSLLVLICAFAAQGAWAAMDAKINFEGAIPAGFSCTEGSQISLSKAHYKDGEQSLCWSWTRQAHLSYTDEAITRSSKVRDGGVILWIYNPTPVKSSLQFSFCNAAGERQCYFDFYMDFKGWRAAWVKYRDMEGFGGRDMQPLAMMIVTTPAGQTKGEVFIDRLTFSETALTRLITPDLPLPQNNKSNQKNFWHWARLWEWSQMHYALPVEPLTEAHKADMERAEKQFHDLIASSLPAGSTITNSWVPKALERMRKANIRRTEDGGVVGAPLLSDDEFNDSKGELRDAYIGDMLFAFALNNYINKDTTYNDHFFLVFDHAVDQGFAYGSARGTNHHYGYQTRRIFDAMWFMRDQIARRGKIDEYHRVLEYWSGLPETRQPYEYGRDETLDGWNTLLQPKMISALMFPDLAERFRALRSLGVWVSGSLMPSPGTVGGIKVDGTTFHHGGFYPAYSIGAFTTLGQYCQVTEGTPFAPDEAGRRSFKLALQTLRRYTNLLDWGLGVAGRHPHRGSVPVQTANAFGALAMLGDLTGSGKSVDPELAGDFLALKGNDKRLLEIFKAEGIVPSTPPQGFFAYNYGAMGIHRRDNWMVTLKAYNNDVWCSEIYARDNRYGRYQSYGTAQIYGSGSPVSAKASGFVEEGWDWNRVPGATTIHLPYSELESAYPGTLMERSSVRFSGVSSLQGQNGLMAFHLIEPKRPRFTPGAEAFATVFCFDDRMVFLGSGVDNNNEVYPTETTLFQLLLDKPDQSLLFDGKTVDAFPLDLTRENAPRVLLTDTKGNSYVVKNAAKVCLVKQKQESPHNKTHKMASNNFVSAYISHGKAPKQAQYEYAVYLQTPENQVAKYARKDPYTVVRKDNTAHVVRDHATGITGYACFGDYAGSGVVKSVTGETIVMERKTKEGRIVMSVCTPDLGLTEKTYSTSQPSAPIVKTVVLSGVWRLTAPNAKVAVEAANGQTELTVTCIDGLPVEFELSGR